MSVLPGPKILHLTYASPPLFGRSSLGQASRFIFDIPQDLIETDSPLEITKTIADLILT